MCDSPLLDAEASSPKWLVLLLGTAVMSSRSLEGHCRGRLARLGSREPIAARNLRLVEHGIASGSILETEEAHRYSERRAQLLR
jgi:hypothetical protein